MAKSDFDITVNLNRYTGMDAHIVIPDGVTVIDWNAFMTSAGTIESVVIPEGVIEIAGNAFRSCKNLKKVTLPKSLRRIEQSAFPEKTNWTDMENHGVDVFVQSQSGKRTIDLVCNKKCRRNGINRFSTFRRHFWNKSIGNSL